MAITESWVGNLGHLALADTALSELLIDILRMLGHRDPVTSPDVPKAGLTTWVAADKIEEIFTEDPDLKPEGADSWLIEVKSAADERNKLTHAVALNRCDTCGDATQFWHPKSNSEVDRSGAMIQEVTRKVLVLQDPRREIAADVARRVNERITAKAQVEANRTGELQNPTRVFLSSRSGRCGGCTDDGSSWGTVSFTIFDPIAPEPGSSSAV